MILLTNFSIQFLLQHVPTLSSLPDVGPDTRTIQAAIACNQQRMRELYLLSNGNIHQDWLSLDRLNQTRRADLNSFGSFGLNSLSARRAALGPIEFGIGGSGITSEMGLIDFRNAVNGIPGGRGPIDFSNAVNGIPGERTPTNISQVNLRLRQQYDATASRPSPSNF